VGSLDHTQSAFYLFSSFIHLRNILFFSFTKRRNLYVKQIASVRPPPLATRTSAFTKISFTRLRAGGLYVERMD